jgi:hypothetical protein
VYEGTTSVPYSLSTFFALAELLSKWQRAAAFKMLQQTGGFVVHKL